MLFRPLIVGPGKTLRRSMLVGFRIIALWIGATALAIPVAGLAADPDAI